MAMAVAEVRREPTSPNSAFELTGSRLVEWSRRCLVGFAQGSGGAE
ncbi:MAG: hypothetical protein RL685_6966 [Pseudomonadota bacterium]|jgi:hypothetical protein